MAWCRQATSHYLSQCWPRSMLQMASLGLNELNQIWIWCNFSFVEIHFKKLSAECWPLCFSHSVLRGSKRPKHIGYLLGGSGAMKPQLLVKYQLLHCHSNNPSCGMSAIGWVAMAVANQLAHSLHTFLFLSCQATCLSAGVVGKHGFPRTSQELVAMTICITTSWK